MVAELSFLSGVKAGSSGGSWAAGEGRKTQVVPRESWCWAVCLALRPSLVLVQASDRSVLWGHG